MGEFITPVFAAKVYGVCLLVVVIFQFALAFGMPWGSISMGGKYPGVYPRKMRIAALFIAAFLVLTGVVIGIRAGLIFPSLLSTSKSLIWFVVFINALGAVMNCITPSKWERIIWAPVTIILFSVSLFLALSS
jgi:hypothetical protein